MAPRWGINYVVVPIGTRDDPAELGDLLALVRAIGSLGPWGEELPCRILDDRTCDLLTVKLLGQEGALPV